MSGIELRAFFLGLVGLALSFYSLTNGQAEWTIGVNGLFGSSDLAKIKPQPVPNGRQIIVGLGVIPSIINGVLSASLIAGVLVASKTLLLPPIIYTISELVKDVSTSIVTSVLVYSRFGNPLTLIFIIFNASVIAFHFYLWYGALQLYEYITLRDDISERDRRMKLPGESPKIYRNEWDFDPNVSLATGDVPYLGSKKTIMEEFEEFKRMEREKEKIETNATKNIFIEPFSDIDIDLIESN
ncbi:uncharacterized protein LOC124165806 [Ischnura elegans]|uniref:uncharacterized protein LOC124165806 n=1 Tax=Ischnura elegans TaxID=197161 RepID=UPI001ED8971A|nr:uncharacterized protein LOC124165806 [Ischnura elegans]